MNSRARSFFLCGFSAIGLVGAGLIFGQSAPADGAISAATQDTGLGTGPKKPEIVSLSTSLDTAPPIAVTKVVLAVNQKGKSQIAYNGFIKRALLEAFQKREVPNAVALTKLATAPPRDTLNTLTEDDVNKILIKKLTSLVGTTPPKDLKRQVALQNAIANRTRRAGLRLGAGQANQPLPNQDRLDWRDKGLIVQDSGIVTAVKDQGTCGCCWAFATIATVEAAYAKDNLDLINASEQYVLNCANVLSPLTGQPSYSCDGGWWAFDLLLAGNAKKVDTPGVPTEADLPYTGQQGSCVTGLNLPYQLQSWGYVAGPNDQSDIPSDSDLKLALCQYGPLATAVKVPLDDTGAPAWAGNSGDVINNFDNDPNQSVNHAIVIVGWDNTKGDRGAWIIKNSWGKGWGIPETGTNLGSGFSYVAFGANNIGWGAAWVQPVQ